jgi:hypothetical protein
LLVLGELWSRRYFQWSFEASWENFESFLHGKLHSPDNWTWDIGPTMDAFNIEAPLLIAIPPQDFDPYRGNPHWMLGNTRSRSIRIAWGPYPHPKIHNVKPNGTVDNRALNASLAFAEPGQVFWPLGYTAWIDLITNPIPVHADTPHLITSDGRRLSPIAARTPSPQNQISLSDLRTIVSMRRWEPIVWQFSEPGTLEPSQVHYAVEAEGTRVSYLPPLPDPHVWCLGLMLLQDVVPEKGTDLPPWWQIDRKLRAEVLHGSDASVTEPLVEELAKLYPGHPLLEHYRIVASMKGPRFTERWLEREQKSCYMPLWYLLPLTNLSWEEVTRLPCFESRNASNPMVKDYVIGAIYLRFWREMERPEISRVIGRPRSPF